MESNDRNPFPFQVRNLAEEPSSPDLPSTGPWSFNQNKDSFPLGVAAPATASSRSYLVPRAAPHLNNTVPNLEPATTSSRRHILSRSATRFTTFKPSLANEDDLPQNKSNSSQSASLSERGSKPNQYNQPSLGPAPEPLQSLDAQPDSEKDDDSDEEERSGAGCENIQDILDGLWEVSKAPRQLQIEFNKLQRSKRRIRKALQKERDRSERLEENLESTRHMIEAIQATARDSELKADEASNANKSLSAECHQLQDQVKSLEDAINFEKSEHEQTQTVLNEKREQYKMEMNKKDTALQKATKEVEYARKQFEDVVVKKESITAERDQCRSDTANLHKQITCFEKKVNDLERTIENERARSRLDIENQKEEIDRIQNENNEQRKKIGELESSIRSYEAERFDSQKEFINIKKSLLAIEELRRNFCHTVQGDLKSTDIYETLCSLQVACFLFERSPESHDNILEGDVVNITAISNYLTCIRGCLAQQFSDARQRETILSKCLSEVMNASEKLKEDLLRGKEFFKLSKYTNDSLKKSLTAAKEETITLSKLICKIREKCLAEKQREEERIGRLKQEMENMNRELTSHKEVIHQTRVELQQSKEEKKNGADENRRKLEVCEKARKDVLRELELCRKTMKERVEELQVQSKTTESVLKKTHASLEVEMLERTKVSRELEKCMTNAKDAEMEAEEATKWAHGVRTEMEKKVEEVKKEKHATIAEKERLQAELSACEAKLAVASQIAEQLKSRVQVCGATLAGSQMMNQGAATIPAGPEQISSPTQGIQGKDSLPHTGSEGITCMEGPGVKEQMNELVAPNSCQDKHAMLGSRSRKRQQKGSAQKSTKTRRVKSSRIAENDNAIATKGNGQSLTANGDDDSDWMVQDSTLGI